MADILCGYTADRDETLVGYLYGELDAAHRASFDVHLATCERCRKELSELGGVRSHLQHWTTPQFDPASASARRAVQPAPRAEPPRTIWKKLADIPDWMQVAAALLFLGVSAGIANLDVRYDREGLAIRTGWSTSREDAVQPGRPASAGDAATAPWRADLASLERQLRADLIAARAPGVPAATAGAAAISVTASEEAILKRTRALIEESERREQRELALRLAEMMRDVDTKRQADLANIDRNLGLIQNNTGVEVARQRELLDYLVRVSSQR